MAIRIPRFRRPSLRARGRTWLILGALAAIIIIFAIWRIATAPEISETNGANIPQVELATAASLAGNTAPLTTVGTVRSSSEAELHARRAGTITNVSYEAGDRVPAGAVIATIENASERAALAQAQARVTAAQANLAKVEGGTRQEQLAVLQENVESAEATLAAARTGARNAIISAYATLDNAILHGVDAIFHNPEGPVPDFKPVSTESVAVTESENMRVGIGEMLEAREGYVMTDAAANTAALNTTEQDLLEAQEFLDRVLTALSGAVENATYTETVLAGYTNTAQTARSNVLSALSAISSARSTLQSAQSSLTVAQQRLAEGTSGAQSEDRIAAEASVAEAQAGLAAAQAAYENTVVRTPIAGTLSSWNISVGSFVTQQQELGIVANEGALEVVAYVPPRERGLISPGNAATIASRFAGTVTNVASGLDASRNLIEVTVGISDDADVLVHGQSVPISISRDIETATDEAPTVLRLPLSAIKLLPDGAVVFSIDADMRLISFPVVLGDIVGSSIVIESGISAQTPVVVDARGLSAGDQVTVTP